ncbi:hypothetical protein F4604DRAFT_1920137 [Suillus subluteus]|nr:hypothetical protein F4604DRAFT_1920137 [Suillus subluteus]
MSMAASHIRASISQYQMEAAHTEEPSAARIMHFKAGLQWEIATFVTPILQYSAARNIIFVVPSPVAHILQLIPELTWNMVPDHIFSSHLCQFQDVADLGDPSRIVSTYGAQWWTGPTAIPNKLWPWDQVFANCVCHYQHWLSGIEDERLVVPEQVDESSVATLKALKWMRERLLTVIEDQQAGIREKMADIQIMESRAPSADTRHPTPTSTEHRAPTADCRLPSTKHRLLTTEHRVLSPEYRVPTPGIQHSALETNDWKQQQNSKLESTDYRIPTTEHRAPSTEHRLPTTDYRLPTNEYRALSTEHRLPTTKHRVPSPEYRVPKPGDPKPVSRG